MVVQKLLCPKCQHVLDDATCVNPDTPDARPGDGDISSCLYCGAVLVFMIDAEQCSFRAMQSEEIAALPSDLQQLVATARSIWVLAKAKGLA